MLSHVSPSTFRKGCFLVLEKNDKLICSFVSYGIEFWLSRHISTWSFFIFCENVWEDIKNDIIPSSLHFLLVSLASLLAFTVFQMFMFMCLLCQHLYPMSEWRKLFPFLLFGWWRQHRNEEWLSSAVLILTMERWKNKVNVKIHIKAEINSRTN